MSGEEYGVFVSAVEVHFANENRKVKIEDGLLTFPAEPDSPQYGLTNLAQACHQEKPSKWQDMIKEHFAIIERTPLSPTTPPFETVQDRILLRLVPPEYAESATDAIYREDIPETLTMVVVDSPESVRSVSQAEAKEWGLTREQLFAMGLKNLKNLSFGEPETIELGEGMNLLAVADDSFFTASLALDLKQHTKWLGQHGCLVGIPTRHMLLLYPIEDKDVLTAIQLLPGLLTNLEREGPGSVTSALYYFDGQTFEPISYSTADGSFSISPSRKFTQVMMRVSKSPQKD